MEPGIIIASYNDHDPGRYGTPWVAPVGHGGRIDFSVRVGGYTGGYHTGRAGNLFITSPVNGAIYAYGQKDFVGLNSYMEFAQYIDGRFEPVEKSDLPNATRK
jgi:hypothetical protein